MVFSNCNVKNAILMESPKRVFLCVSFINELVTINLFNMPSKVSSLNYILMCSQYFILSFTYISKELISLLVILNSLPFS